MLRFAWVLAPLIAGMCWTASLEACPFCSAVSQTFSEEINSMDVVVIGELLQPPAASKPGSQEVPQATFGAKQVVKGKSFVREGGRIQTTYFGQGRVGQPFLLMAVDPPKLMWSTPLQLSSQAAEYVTQLLALPASGPARLEFFQRYLEDDDEMLARDAYDEFAKAPYDEVKQLKARMDHDQLVQWIQDPDIPASRRRLYFTMLGVCGSTEDVPLLERLLRSDDRQDKAGLDALIGCYLTLIGSEGMPLVEELFLKDEDAEYADTYAAIMALRFHGSETDRVPRERILEGLRHMLDRPQLADLVIPDLARWEDWSVMTRLVQLFKQADEKSSWVRVPVINYLRACPLPEAKDYIAELEKVDPDAVKRANTFFPFGAATSAAAPSKS